jgi:hypothetical protein
MPTELGKLQDLTNLVLGKSAKKPFMLSMLPFLWLINFCEFDHAGRNAFTDTVLPSEFGSLTNLKEINMGKDGLHFCTDSFVTVFLTSFVSKRQSGWV